MVPRSIVAAAIGVALLVGCPGDDAGPSPVTTAGGSGGSSSAGLTSGPDTTDAGGASGDDAGPGSSGPAGPEYPCASVDECYLHGDCCSCVARHRDAPVPDDCPADCDRTACDVWGLTEALCSHTCLVKLVECDAAMVTCADAPPDCPAGERPSLDERCWSGHCVPDELCRP